MAFLFPKPPQPRKVSATTLNRGILLLYDFCEQLRRHGLQHTATEVASVAALLSESPEIPAEAPKKETVH